MGGLLGRVWGPPSMLAILQRIFVCCGRLEGSLEPPFTNHEKRSFGWPYGGGRQGRHSLGMRLPLGGGVVLPLPCGFGGLAGGVGWESVPAGWRSSRRWIGAVDVQHQTRPLHTCMSWSANSHSASMVVVKWRATAGHGILA